MHPYLVRLGPFRLPAYGVFVSMGFFLAAYLAGKRAPREGIERDSIYDLAFWILLSGVLGARLYFVLQHLGEFASSPVSILFVWRGGLAIIGGIVAGAAGAVAYCRIKGLPLFKTLDIVAWALPLAQAVGRIGCFFAGCCYGKPCSLSWAVVFKNPDSLAPIGVPLHPTQLYHMFSNLLVFFVLSLVYRRKSFEGQILSLYLMLYSVGRFIVEFFRGDNRGFWGPLSVPQWLCVGMFLVGAALYFALRRRRCCM